MNRTLTALLALPLLLTACGDEDERITQLETALAELQTSTNERLVQLETKDDEHDAAIESVVAAAAANTASVEDLEHLTEPMSRMDVADADSIVFEGVNVHVRNGLEEMGCDDGAGLLPSCNGLGNLFVGYNEGVSAANQIGSHNAIIGQGIEFSSFSGLLVGKDHSASSPASTIIGGEGNSTTGAYSAVFGGSYHTAEGQFSTVSGGFGGTASGRNSIVLGGYANDADGIYSATLGGLQATASGDYSTVTGGRENDALGEYSTVSGGYQRSTGDTAPANQYDWVAGPLFEDQ